MNPIITMALIILGLPLIAYGLTFFFGEKLPRRGDFIGIIALAITWLLSLRPAG